MTEHRKVRLIMVPKVYKKHNWPIPIIRNGEEYITGQKLSTKKKTGEIELTEEERIKYPSVINPMNMYYGVHRKLYDLDDPGERALYDLMIVSGQVAASEMEYKNDRDRFVAYFFDPDQEAVAINALRDLQFEAESKVRKMSITEYDKVLLSLSYKIPGYNLGSSLKFMSPDRKRKEVLEACQKYPQEVLNCFSDINPGIEEELFIIELINAQILIQKQDGSIMHGSAYISDSIDGVKKYLGKEDNQYLRKKWTLMLDERKGMVPQGTSNRFASKNKAYTDMTLEELHRYINNPANKLPKSKFKENYNDREAIINQLNVHYADATA